MLSTTSGAVPAIQMISATTTDSKSVTIEYNVNQTPDCGYSNPVWCLSLERRQVRFKRHACQHLHASPSG